MRKLVWLFVLLMVVASVPAFAQFCYVCDTYSDGDAYCGVYSSMTSPPWASYSCYAFNEGFYHYCHDSGANCWIEPSASEDYVWMKRAKALRAFLATATSITGVRMMSDAEIAALTSEATSKPTAHEVYDAYRREAEKRTGRPLPDGDVLSVGVRRAKTPPSTVATITTTSPH